MTLRWDVGFSIIMSVGGCCTIVTFIWPCGSTLTSSWVSLYGSPMLGAFPRAFLHRIPPVDLDDPCAGAWTFGAGRWARSRAKNIIHI